MISSKPRIYLYLIIFVLIAAAVFSYSKWVSPTKIALVHFQNNTVAGLAKSAGNSFIHLKSFEITELEKAAKYDIVIIAGTGLRLTGEQHQLISELAASGKPVYVSSATNPENNISSLAEDQGSRIAAYLSNGGENNYHEFLNYLRREIDQKTLFSHPVIAPEETDQEVLFFPGEKKRFKTPDEYEKYGLEKGLLREGLPKVVILSGIADPFNNNSEQVDSLYFALQQKGINVYAYSGMPQRLEILQAIRPGAVVYFPHGRVLMANPDIMTAWLKQQNIPLFTPVSLLQDYEQWMENKQGMTGGFMNQTVVIPELDGAIMPYVYFAPQKDKDGLYPYRVIPERLHTFVESIHRYLLLKSKPNADKKLAIYYLKDPGSNSLTAANMEVIPSLYNLLTRLRSEGYTIRNLPANVQEFSALLAKQGVVLEPYARGAISSYLKDGSPELIERAVYEKWAAQSFPAYKYAEVVTKYGEAPGEYFSVRKEDKAFLAVARIDFGNVVVLPQPLAGTGEDAFAMVHGEAYPPPHPYLASYLWVRYGFGADALMHFGTHGSLEFIKGKGVALSSDDWSDRLIGNLPHLYVYTISNPGEAMMAKRRAYATTITHLTPPFMESATREEYKAILESIRSYYTKSGREQEIIAGRIKKLAITMGLHRDLRLDSTSATPYTAEEIDRIEHFAEEIASSKMTGNLYTLGVPYAKDKIKSTVLAMAADPLAYSLAVLDKQRNRITEAQVRNRVFFNTRYLYPSQRLITEIIDGRKNVSQTLISQTAGIREADLKEARGYQASAAPKRPGRPGAPVKKEEETKPVPPARKAYFEAVLEVERTLSDVVRYKGYLETGPSAELNSIVNALNGGYTLPSPGGDPIVNPNTLPTGRNLYAINVEAAPTPEAWEKGVSLTHDFIRDYKKRHNSAFPRRVNMTLWSSSFIETNGAPFAQILYMLGVEPVRDAFGRVTDLRLIPSSELGRPRIDVVVQTSGQLRDLAASRMFLVNKAVRMASEASDKEFQNYVASSTQDAEKELIAKGASPAEARKLSLYRIFGGLNGNYSTGITGMVESSGEWTSEEEVALTYINNMGASYDTEDDWGEQYGNVLQTMLANTDAVIHNRQSNTWGALSLDHVYEFMGGVNLAVRHITGNEPDAYFSDYRNRHQPRVQELKEAIGVEARTTLFNPAYIREQMKGGAGSAGSFSETFMNIFGWSVMKKDLIDQELWDQLYDTYVLDKDRLGISSFFKKENPYALEEMTAIMLEGHRKGYWAATEEQLRQTAGLHVDLVNTYGSSSGGMTAGNKLLQQEIAGLVTGSQKTGYEDKIRAVSTGTQSGSDGKTMVLEKEGAQKETRRNTGISSEAGERSSGIVWIISGLILALIAGLIIFRKKGKGPDNH